MDDQTIVDRQKRAALALAPYLAENGGKYDSVVDLLTDLRHWCRFRLNFDDAVRLSDSHFHAEAYGEDE